MAFGAVFRLASIAIVVALICLHGSQAKKVFLECMPGYPVPMNTIVQGAKPNDPITAAFVTAADMYGAVEIPNDNNYKNVEIFTQCIHLMPSTDTCTPVFKEKSGKTPLYSVQAGKTLAIFGPDFEIGEACLPPPNPPG